MPGRYDADGRRHCVLQSAIGGGNGVADHAAFDSRFAVFRIPGRTAPAGIGTTAGTGAIRVIP